MKGEIVGCLAVATSIMVCVIRVNQRMGMLVNLGRAAVLLGLQVV